MLLSRYVVSIPQPLPAAVYLRHHARARVTPVSFHAGNSLVSYLNLRELYCLIYEGCLVIAVSYEE